MGIIGDIAEVTKAVGQIAVKPLLAIALASGALLYAPAHIIAATGLADFLATYRMWIGFALLASCAYLLAHGLAWVFNVIGSLIGDVQMRKVRRKWLTTLTPGEKAVLVPYIRDEATSVTYSLNNGAVRGLEGKGVLYRASSVSYGLAFPFNMQPWAREILSAEPELLM
ncbi:MULTISPECIES: superinfection exclusion B family protein [Ralstonia solanacearum species complex]|uniref:superinfection exclusion B family protein n=1 Tax=Ralstonia solanacearum species complex TaxID=3116862 RepID=UPI0018D1C485|nr:MULTISPECIES: superinfection exclusion B family protein [Ralstonia solanacearum species complex]MDN3368269.1 superinfection exclusion B family protein [Ralstonia pseudosolanacearum]